MISLLLIILAAFFNAVMDVLQFHYSISIFIKKSFDRFYWDPQYSWLNKYNNRTYADGLIKWGFMDKPACLTDAWHLSKTLMIFSLVGSIISFDYTYITLITDLFQIANAFLYKVVHAFAYVFVFSLYGSIWIWTFNLFYNRWLIEKD